MDDHHDGTHAREPQAEDLARLCASLNSAGARYVLIGGFAVIAHGASRTTKDIDLLVDDAPDNIRRLRIALQVLEDHAVDEVGDDDVRTYSVVRVADEFVVDLMGRACGVDYAEAVSDAETIVFEGVPIPVASPSTLIKTKDTLRPSDHADRRYLVSLLAERSNEG